MRHPYTRRLLSSTSLYRNWQEAGTLETEAIAIDMEVQKEGYEGCPYAGRCGKVDERCKSACPPLRNIGNGHHVACYRL